MLYLKNPKRFFKHLITVPLVSTLIIPLVIADLWVEIYHRLCFPLYRLPRVKRENYIKIMDRFRLPYLNILQKIYCAYCGYGNGLIRYWTKIAADTEGYWCGIQHKKVPNFAPPKYQADFAEYGNEQEFKNKYTP